MKTIAVGADVGVKDTYGRFVSLDFKDKPFTVEERIFHPTLDEDVYVIADKQNKTKVRQFFTERELFELCTCV